MYNTSQQCLISVLALKKVHSASECRSEDLTTKAVQRATLAFQSEDNVPDRHCLALGVLCVRHGVAKHVLQKRLQYIASLFVDETGDALDTASPSKTPNGMFS